MKKRHDFKGDTDIAVCLNKIINHIHFTKTVDFRDYETLLFPERRVDKQLEGR